MQATWLNSNPVLYRGKNYYIVLFGLFAGLATFLGACVFTTYLTSKHIYLHHSIEYWAAILIFLMALFSKLFHVLVVGKEFFNNPLKYLQQTAFYNQGGQIGFGVGVILMGYVENISLLMLLDVVTCAGAFALIIARLGCYNYGCCYGKVTNGPWGVNYAHPDSKILRLHPELQNVPVLPTQLFESTFAIFLFGLMTYLFSSNIQAGMTAFVFIILYNGFRILIHPYRANDTLAGCTGEDQNVFKCVACVLTMLGIAWFIYALFIQQPAYYAAPQPITFKLLIETNLSSPIHLLSLLIISSCIFFIYGYHYKKLGRHF